jgi:hypothetical protein
MKLIRVIINWFRKDKYRIRVTNKNLTYSNQPPPWPCPPRPRQPEPGCRGIFVALWFILTATAAAQCPLTLVWNPNTETNLAGYRLYKGAASRIYTQVTDVGRTTNVTISVPYGSTNFYVLTAYNTQGQESSFSPELAHVTRTNAPIAPPTGLQVEPLLTMSLQGARFPEGPWTNVWDVVVSRPQAGFYRAFGTMNR